jgi:hypothetical protein
VVGGASLGDGATFAAGFVGEGFAGAGLAAGLRTLDGGTERIVRRLLGGAA